jgi:hypothetical protein
VEKTKIISNKDKGGNFYTHFTQWTIDIDKCPMYMYQIGSKIKSWPTRAKLAIEKFHSTLTLRNLKKFILKIGVGEFKKLQIIFPEFRNCGYSLREILDKDHEIIEIERKSYGDKKASISSISSISSNTSNENESESLSD